MTYDERESLAARVVEELGELFRSRGILHEEVACVLLHATAIAERRSASAHALGLRPASEPSALQVIAHCRAELQRRAG